MLEISGRDIRTARNRSALLAALDGVIARGLADDETSEIIVDPSGAVFFDRVYGAQERQVGEDLAPAQLMHVITKMAGHYGYKLDEGLLECELPWDGSRVQACLPPITQHATLNIRKTPKTGAKRRFRLANYAMCGAFRRVFDEIVLKRRSAVFIGATGSGKTSALGATINHITDLCRDRVVTIEDAWELWCESESWVALHATPTISMRRLLKVAMRLKPDWLCVGEVRGEEAIEAIMGMHTHPGLSSVHGRTIQRGLSRIRSCTRIDGKDTVSTEDICDAIDYAILMQRARPEDGGGRFVAEIAQVVGYKDGRFVLEPVSEGD